MDIKNLCLNIEDWIINVRRDLHKTPELGLKEFQTREKIKNYLDEIGIDYIEYKNTTALVAEINNGFEKTVALRADIDALPISEELDLEYKSQNEGVMHACGHDAHTAMLLGACKVLYENRDLLKVNVKFFFQPGEEIGAGKYMIEEGCLENPKVDMIFGMHVGSHIKTGYIEIKKGTAAASTDRLILKVLGKNGHGAYPHEGIDAIVIASYLVTALQSIVSRNIDPTDSVVISFGKIEGGHKGNIICDEVKLTGTLRTLNEDSRHLAKEKIKSMCENISAGFGGKVNLEIIPGIPTLVNNSELVDLVVKNTSELLGDDKVLEKEKSPLGAEDFS
ncbi:M20 metallopeptidase family protein, partial [Intestinibacter sp.]|uniref:M20 metallopeptidase family protein n=1 Tax=Intestinibacter sp. TaxID=1965304 RepID=UPI003F14264F